MIEPDVNEDVNELFALAGSPVVVADVPVNGRKNGRVNGHKPAIHRQLPYSEEAELGALCSFMLQPNEVGGVCVELGITRNSFHLPATSLVFNALNSMWSNGKAIDLVTATVELRGRGELELAGGAGFISQVSNYLPTAANARFYLETLRDKHTLREAIRICTEHAGKGYEDQEDVQAFISRLHSDVTGLAIRKRRHKSIKQQVTDTLQIIQDRSDGTLKQIRTGIKKLDEESPIRPGDFVVIAGRRKSGKSALAADIIKHECIDNKYPVAVFSLEMPDYQWIERLFANVGRVSLSRITKGKLEEREYPAITAAASKIAESGLNIFDLDVVRDLDGICGRVRQLKVEKPNLRLAVVDYCQLVQFITSKKINRQEEVAEVSRALKVLAGELGIVVIGLSQLNKDGDTRESQALENDCTALWKVLEELDDKFQPIPGKENKRTLAVPFQRNGPPGVRIHLTFHGHQSRFEEDSPEDHPELGIETKPKSRPPKSVRKEFED